MKRFLLSVIVPLTFLFSACADGDETSETSQTSGQALTVQAAFAETAAVGQNTIEIDVTDEAGDPVTDATVTVDPQMPSMGHGSSEVPVVTSNEDGSYSAFPVTLQMGGEWVVTISAVRGEDSGTVDVTVAAQ